MQNETKRPVNWLSTALIGALLVITGGMIIFFPKAAMSMVMVMAAIILFVMGFTDMIAALRYKSDTQSWKTTLSSGIVTLIAGIFMGVTIYMPVDAMTIVIVLCAWAVIRCLCTLVGVIFGKLRRKGTIISSVVLGIAGILVFIFRDVIAASTMMIGYILLGVGGVLMIAGFYSRAAINEKTEAIEQQKREDRKQLIEDKITAVHEAAKENLIEEERIRTLVEGQVPEEDASVSDEEQAPSEEEEAAGAEEAADSHAQPDAEDITEAILETNLEGAPEEGNTGSSTGTEEGTEEPEKSGFFSLFRKK